MHERTVTEARMSGLITPTRADRGWFSVMTAEMGQQAGVAENSLIVPHLGPGEVFAEILAPVDPGDEGEGKAGLREVLRSVRGDEAAWGLTEAKSLERGRR